MPDEANYNNREKMYQILWFNKKIG